MRYKVRIKAKGVWNAHKRALFQNALQYAHYYMDLFKLGEHIDFRLVGDPYAPGSCIDAGYKYIVHISGAQSDREIVETLFHELTHVKQYALGYLADDEKTGKVYWLGSYYKGDFQDTFSKEYWNAPWEVEARQMGKELRKNYYQM